MSIWKEPPPKPVVTAISRDDPDMKQAYSTASETLDAFVAHLQIDDGRMGSFKLRFRDPELSERLGEDRLFYWWLDFAVHHPEDDHFSGVFTELPECLLPHFQVGQRLHADAEDIFDWRVNDEGTLYGGFTIRVTRSRIPDEERADYDRYIGVERYSDQALP
jgi:uncharacterized protein YegJ (DUF2314 family)